MQEVLDELEQWVRDGEEVALATVVETWGSSPRPLGSKMVVTRSGKMAGSVSNGCIEGAVFEEAQKVLKSGQPKVAAYGVADDVAFEVGLACGGHIEVFLQPLAPVHQRLMALLDRDEPATLRTNLVTGEAELTEGSPSGSELAHRDGDVLRRRRRSASRRGRERRARDYRATRRAEHETQHSGFPRLRRRRRD